MKTSIKVDDWTIERIPEWRGWEMTKTWIDEDGVEVFLQTLIYDSALDAINKYLERTANEI